MKIPDIIGKGVDSCYEAPYCIVGLIYKEFGPGDGGSEAPYVFFNKLAEGTGLRSSIVWAKNDSLDNEGRRKYLMEVLDKLGIEYG